MMAVTYSNASSTVTPSYYTYCLSNYVHVVIPKAKAPKDNYRFLRLLLAKLLLSERFPPKVLPPEDLPVIRRWFLPITHKRARPRVMVGRNA